MSENPTSVKNQLKKKTKIVFPVVFVTSVLSTPPFHSRPAMYYTLIINTDSLHDPKYSWTGLMNIL